MPEVLPVPVIIGLVEVAKRMGLPTAWAPVVAVGLGLLWSVTEAIVGPGPGPEAVWQAIVRGLALGLSAAGLYDVGKQAVKASNED
jgi:hypothetical protein